MSYLKDIKRRDVAEEKAAAYDADNLQLRFRDAYNEGSNYGALATQKGLERALFAKQQKIQQEAELRRNMDAGFNYQPTGPSWSQEIGTSMNRVANSVGEQVSAFAGDVKNQAGQWIRDGVDYVSQGGVNPNIALQAKEDEIAQQKHVQEQIPVNMTPADRRAAILEYEQFNMRNK
jgi:hypothetical protein